MLRALRVREGDVGGALRQRLQATPTHEGGRQARAGHEDAPGAGGGAEQDSDRLTSPLRRGSRLYPDKPHHHQENLRGRGLGAHRRQGELIEGAARGTREDLAPAPEGIRVLDCRKLHRQHLAEEDRGEAQRVRSDCRLREEHQGDTAKGDERAEDQSGKGGKQAVLVVLDGCRGWKLVHLHDGA